MSTIIAANLAGPTSTGTAATLASINGGSISGSRNRIINGDMRIDQRNAGAGVTPTNGQYLVDRFSFGATQASKFTSGQGSGGAPTGFSNYYAFTSSSAYSVLSGDYFIFQQLIEGLNISDLNWGTASARSVTLSFVVLSSLTGTFTGSIRNSAGTRSHPFTYSIPSANTWTTISVTIPGDTAGTWLTNTGIGMIVAFNLGTGSTFNSTAGVWTAGNFLSAPGATNVVSTTAATWYITGVQLEAGTIATPFERRSFGQELALCQRYYEVGTWSCSGLTHVSNGDTRASWQSYAVSKRVSPSVSLNTNAISIFAVGPNGSGVNLNGSVAALQGNLNGFTMESMGNFTNISNAVGGGDYSWGLRNFQSFFASAEL